jgi:hypothetical protein
MPRYGEAPLDNPVLADFLARKEGEFPFRLYPRLWGTKELADYYKGRKWEVVKFTDPPPVLPDEPGIYMFVAGPYCGGLTDHSYIFYVGKATSLKRRYPEYLIEKAGGGSNPRERVVLFLNHFDGYLQFHYTLVPKEELTSAESLLKDNLTPYGNTQLELRGRLAE